MKYFVINGRGGCGKDTFVKLCQEFIKPNMSLNISTIDDVKEIAKLVGWNGGKTNDDRAFLASLKELLARYNDFPHKTLMHKIDLYRAHLESYDQPTDEAVVFIHCREPRAIDRLKEELGAVTVLIRRPSLEEIEYGNKSDDEVNDYPYDHIINNCGTIEELRCWALALMAVCHVDIQRPAYEKEDEQKT